MELSSFSEFPYPRSCPSSGMSSVHADIESSLEVCEILNLEVQTLSKDAATLDEEISALGRKKAELEETIEGYKVTQITSVVSPPV